MKYIDLTKGIYTNPCTGDEYSCRINSYGNVYYLDIALCGDFHPFRMIDLKDFVSAKMFCRDHGIIPHDDFLSPCFSTKSEVERLADILNDEIQKIGGLYGQKFVGVDDYDFNNTIKLEFE